MTAKEQATVYFKEGYNCAQAVTLAFKDKLDLDEKTVLRLSSSFGGGMGRMREVCGAVSGMFVVLGLLEGYDDPNAKSEKIELYSAVRRLASEFKEVSGSIICRELLEGSGADLAGEDRSPEYYKKRPCAELVGDAAEILERYLARTDK